jgi:tRNA G46 methylase TrmB
VEYANWIAEEFLRNSFYESVYDETIQSTSHLEDHVITWFEQEQRRLGYEPNFMLFKKI